MRSCITNLETDEGELELLVMFDYQPAEAQTLTYPGCDEDVDLTEITINNGALKGMSMINLLSPQQLDELTMKAWESME